MKGSVTEFNAYLTEQVGMPYVWGAQHLKLTPDNYVKEITKREKDEAYRKTAIEFCEKLFAEGYTVLYAYDCSGLGMYWLQNLKKILSHDLSANGMMGLCEIVDAPKCGYWVFRLGSDGKATHIGYMVDDAYCIHAKGRAYGVLKEKYKASYWHRIGKPSCMDFDEPEPQPVPPEPEPPVPPVTTTMIKVKGSVNVRKKNSAISAKIRPAAKDCLLPYLGQATSYPYWYMTVWQGQEGYITSKEKYTDLVTVEIEG